MRRLAFLHRSLPSAALLAAALLTGAASAQTPPSAATAPPAKPSPAQPPSAAPPTTPSAAPAAKPPAQPPTAAPSAAPAAPPAAPSADPATPPDPGDLKPSPQPVSKSQPVLLPYMVSLQKGQQLMAARRDVEAAHELAGALRGAMGDPRAPRELPYHIANVLQQARARIGVLTVAADLGRDVEVDGVPVGKAPILGEVLLAPGNHRVLARGDLCLGNVDFELKAGETRRIKVPCQSAPAWRTPALILGLVGTGLGLAVGGILFGVADSRASEINSRVEQARQLGYVEPGLPLAVEQAERTRVDLLNTSITSFLIGGAFAAGTAAVFFGVKPRRPDEPAPLVGLRAGPGHAGLWVRW